MRYSEAKRIILDARSRGFSKIPRFGIWEKRMVLPMNHFCKMSITNKELLYSNIPLNECVEMEYNRRVKEVYAKVRGTL